MMRNRTSVEATSPEASLERYNRTLPIEMVKARGRVLGSLEAWSRGYHDLASDGFLSASREEPNPDIKLTLILLSAESARLSKDPYRCGVAGNVLTDVALDLGASERKRLLALASELARMGDDPLLRLGIASGAEFMLLIRSSTEHEMDDINIPYELRSFLRNIDLHLAAGNESAALVAIHRMKIEKAPLAEYTEISKELDSRLAFREGLAMELIADRWLEKGDIISALNQYKYAYHHRIVKTSPESSDRMRLARKLMLAYERAAENARARLMYEEEERHLIGAAELAALLAESERYARYRSSMTITATLAASLEIEKSKSFEAKGMRRERDGSLHNAEILLLRAAQYAHENGQQSVEAELHEDLSDVADTIGGKKRDDGMPGDATLAYKRALDYAFYAQEHGVDMFDKINNIMWKKSTLTAE